MLLSIILNKVFTVDSTEYILSCNLLLLSFKLSFSISNSFLILLFFPNERNYIYIYILIY